MSDMLAGRPLLRTTGDGRFAWISGTLQVATKLYRKIGIGTDEIGFLETLCQYVPNGRDCACILMRDLAQHLADGGEIHLITGGKNPGAVRYVEMEEKP